MHLSLINPYIRVAMESKISEGHNISRRVIYDYEIIYLESGSFTLIYDDVSYRCKKGDIILIRPGISHSFQIDSGDILQPHIHFDITHRANSEIIPVSFKDLNRMTELEREWIHRDYFSAYPKIPIIFINEKDEFLKYFYQIVTHTDDALIKKAIMLRLISMVIRDNFPKKIENSAEHSIAQRIKDYIDAGNGLTMALDKFSDMFCYNKFYLEKKFKEAFGIGIVEYRNGKRMKLADELLKTKNVTDVAYELGYQSIYSFSRAYKLYYGVSPSKRILTR